MKKYNGEDTRWLIMFENTFTNFDTIRDRGETDGQTPHDGIRRAAPSIARQQHGISLLQ